VVALIYSLICWISSSNFQDPFLDVSRLDFIILTIPSISSKIFSEPFVNRLQPSSKFCDHPIRPIRAIYVIPPVRSFQNYDDQSEGSPRSSVMAIVPRDVVGDEVFADPYGVRLLHDDIQMGSKFALASLCFSFTKIQVVASARRRRSCRGSEGDLQILQKGLGCPESSEMSLIIRLFGV
jgi:hypothetical protein